MQPISRSAALQLAWTIRKQNPAMPWGDCQRKAWATLKLKAGLKQGAMIFEFIKADGSLRIAVGTTNAGLFEYTHKGNPKSDSATLVTFFDLQCGDWRSCRADRLVMVAA